MLDIKFIRENPQKVKEGCQKKQVKIDIDRLLEIDKDLRSYRQEYEKWQADLNKLSKSRPDEKTMRAAKNLKSKIKSRENIIKNLEKGFQNLMLQIPNLPLDDVPIGKDERDNVVLREVAASGEPRPPGREKKPKFSFKPRDHLEIAEKLDLIDIKRAAKVSGTRFGYLKKEAALIEFALINLALDILIKKGFIPMVPPVMLKSEMARGMGYLEQTDEEEAYFLPKDNLYLAGTAEQSVGTMHTNEIFEEKELPKRYVAFSSCFRREAGAYGKDTKGIFRVHQFDKVEMFSFCKPEDSQKEHQFLLEMEEKLMQALKIPYRIVQICTGDLGNPTAAKYDIEAWLPSENRYRETHSTSNCTDFQARRLNIRFRKPAFAKASADRQEAKNKKQLEFVHTLNGTAFAIGRTLIAIIENYQQKDGSIKIPKVLEKYLGKSEIK